MSTPATAALEFKDLSKGLLTFSPDTGVPDGFYVDAQNMLLTNRAPVTIGGLTKFNTTTCPDGNIVWFEPHTNKAGLTVMIVATDTGRLYKYNLTGDVWTELRRDLTTGVLVWTSVPFRGELIMANSAPDLIMRYDADGTRVSPVGAKVISDFEDAASWTNGAASTTNIRESLTSMTYSHGGAGTITASRVLPATIDLLTGLNGAPNFGDTDHIDIQFYVSDATKLPTSAPQNSSLTESTYVYLGYSTSALQFEWAQQFTAATNYSVSKIQLYTGRVGNPGGTIHLEIQTNSAGLPSNTIVTNGTSISINSADIPAGGFNLTEFTFPTPPALTSGTVYHIVAKRTWTPNAVDYMYIETATTATDTSAVNTGGAPTTWAEAIYQLRYAVFDTASAAMTAKIMSDTNNYYTGAYTATLVNGWNRLSLLRSAFVTTGSPNWNAITRLELSTTASGAVTIAYDDWYIIYDLAPPKGRLVEMYAQQLCVAGITTDPVLLRYSDAGSIDHFSEDQEATFSGGRHALEKTDQITALFSYFDELLVGKVNSAWTFSGTGLNVSISALPLTIGIDTHHGVAETPWSIQYLFENNIFGARLTSRGLVSTNISSLLSTIDNTNLDKVVTIRHDRTHTLRWSFRTTAASPATQNDLGLLYDYVLDGWTSKYTPKIRWMTRAIVNGNRELLCGQYDGYIRRMDVGTDFDGTAIESFVTMPWVQLPDDQKDSHVSRWYNVTCYLKGTASVNIDARFADEPHEFNAAAFSTYGTIQATPDGDKGFAFLGKTARWMQLRLRATSLAFEICPPIVIGLAPTERRI